MNEQPSKIYLLPNLMTAGNLFCGFTATLKILEGALLQSTNADAAAELFHAAIWFILGAFVFDFLDGRLARLGGHESAFGREFDSLADIVSFGLGCWFFFASCCSAASTIRVSRPSIGKRRNRSRDSFSSS